ncbi:diguanylate cyclase domain-containing protein, partial [Campylobacter concisus]|uniref:diguanylate cyclase domain-containing protein n=1 Tax=Campylobacter concisus TaxID=199 RepID=UPI001CB7230E
LFLFLIVAFAILGYYFRASNHINEIRLAEERLLEMKTKEKNSKMVELEMINLSLETISEKDYLTSLDNRDSLLNKLKEMCEKLDNQKEIAVYYINISRFKNINTSYGHEIGDKILKFIAKRMRLICNKEEVVSRVGSDEFIILSKMDIGSHTKRMKFGMRLKDAIEDSLHIDKYHFSLRSVIGIYVVTNKNIDNAIRQIEICNNTPTIGIIEKNSFTKVELEDKNKLDLSGYIPRSKFLEALNRIFKDNNVLIIGTTGNTSREMYAFMKNTNNFYMVGNMGGALSIGLGAAKAGKNVIVCGGDAEFVMHMGGLTTAGRYKNDVNLTYVLFDNESNKSTGGQSTYQKHLDYINIAKACGLYVVDN